MEDSRGNRSRAVFRADPMGRFLYVLDYPAREKQNRTFTLQLVRAGERMGTGSEPMGKNRAKTESSEVPVPIFSPALRRPGGPAQ